MKVGNLARIKWTTDATNGDGNAVPAVHGIILAFLPHPRYADLRTVKFHMQTTGTITWLDERELEIV